jgi:uncharacterized protein (TIRG00374 family)
MSAATRQRFPAWLIPTAGYAVSIACLVHVYRHFNWAEQWPRIQAVPTPAILAAVLTDIAVYCVQGWRWNLLLSPLGSLPKLRTMQAIYVGLFANEVLPLRPGEVIRSLLQARWSGVPFSVVVSSVIIERLFDGIWLIAAFFAASFFVELPELLVVGSRILAVLLLGIGCLLAFAILAQERAERWLQRTIWAQGFHHLLGAVGSMSHSPSFYQSFLWSGLYLALQAAPIYFLATGFQLGLTLGECAILLVIIRLGAVPPQAPGNVGTFQWLVVVGVMLFGVARETAIGFATLLFLVITVPLWTVGFVALLATGMKLSQLRREAVNEPETPHATSFSSRSAGL